MFNRKLKKRIEWLENEVNYMIEMEKFNKKKKIKLPPVNKNHIHNC